MSAKLKITVNSELNLLSVLTVYYNMFFQVTQPSSGNIKNVKNKSEVSCNIKF